MDKKITEQMKKKENEVSTEVEALAQAVAKLKSVTNKKRLSKKNNETKDATKH